MNKCPQRGLSYRSTWCGAWSQPPAEPDGEGGAGQFIRIPRFLLQRPALSLAEAPPGSPSRCTAHTTTRRLQEQLRHRPRQGPSTTGQLFWSKKEGPAHSVLGISQGATLRSLGGVTVADGSTGLPQQASPRVQIPAVSPASASPVQGLCPRPAVRLLLSAAARTEKCQRSANYLAWSRPQGPPGTHRACNEFWRVVIHVCHRDDGCGCVREAVVEISLHVCGLNNDCVLLNFLEGTRWGRAGRQLSFSLQAAYTFHQRSVLLGGARSSWASGPHEARWPHGSPQTLSARPGGRMFSVGNRAA